MSQKNVVKRIKKVPVSFELLIDMLKNGYSSPGPIETVDGIPDDAVFAGSYFDGSKLSAYLFFSHESFDEVPEGSYPTEMVPTHRLKYDSRHLENMLERWLFAYYKLQERNDAVLDAIIDSEMYDISTDTARFINLVIEQHDNNDE